MGSVNRMFCIMKFLPSSNQAPYFGFHIAPLITWPCLHWSVQTSCWPIAFWKSSKALLCHQLSFLIFFTECWLHIIILYYFICIHRQLGLIATILVFMFSLNQHPFLLEFMGHVNNGVFLFQQHLLVLCDLLLPILVQTCNLLLKAICG
jgi:hypothetical protein